jgi:hypothetical protein
MAKFFEHAWVSLLNSNRFRRFAKQGTGRTLFQSQSYNRLHSFANYWWSYYQCTKTWDIFQQVKSYCCFIGHNKSGTSMIGALLDAHPNVILADDVGALKYISAGFSRDQLFHLLLKGSRRERMKGRVTGRRLDGYSYLIPGQLQGCYTQLQVIGDSTSGSSTRRLGEDPSLLDRMRNIMPGVNVKFIQVIRNPYDPIAISMVRGKRTFSEAVEHYFTKCDLLVELTAQIGKENLLAMRYEDFILNAEENLSKICNFLGIETTQDYLQACAAILYQSPIKDRQRVEWDEWRIGVVKDKIAQYQFLQGYSFGQ